MQIVLLGAPGAGKGTQAKRLAEELRLPHISTGDILRQNVSGGTDLGREAKGYMEKGALVPDELVTKMLIERLRQPDTSKGFILDGYPRNLNQAKTLDSTLKERNIAIDIVIDLDTSEPVIIQRLTGRLVCKGCGANFHVKNMPPKIAMTCDNCAGKLYQRTDDNEATIRTRLQVYKKEVTTLLDYYRKSDKLRSVKADEDAPVVLKKLIALSKEYDDSPKV